MSIETLLKLHDAMQMTVDALNEELEKHAPPESRKLNWNPDIIEWVKAEGSRGPYERYPQLSKKAEFTTDYRNMLADLENRKGRLTRYGYFYWLFSDSVTV